MRSYGALRILVLLTAMGAISSVRASSGPVGPAAPGASAYDIESVGRILDTISSPARRDKLAEEWLGFARQSITRSLDIGQQWVDVQKLQVRSQVQSDQLRADMLNMQMEIERLHKENLAMESENLRLRLQLQQAGSPATSATPPAQSP
jgi:hypothetical protein